MITNGRMATEVNQRGYDVVSAEGERISVKTTASAGGSGHVSFNPRSLAEVDRVIVLRINTDEMQVETLLDAPVSEVMGLLSTEINGKRNLSISRLDRRSRPRSEIKTVQEISYMGYIVKELENGSIEVEKDGAIASPSKPVLRKIAMALSISLFNAGGNPLNTRQLGSQIIRSVQQLNTGTQQSLEKNSFGSGS